MDTHATTPTLINMQSQLRFFNDLALECNNRCVANFDSKNLDNDERACVKSCFKKQKHWNDKFQAATSNK